MKNQTASRKAFFSMAIIAIISVLIFSLAATVFSTQATKKAAVTELEINKVFEKHEDAVAVITNATDDALIDKAYLSYGCAVAPGNFCSLPDWKTTVNSYVTSAKSSLSPQDAVTSVSTSPTDITSTFTCTAVAGPLTNNYAITIGGAVPNNIDLTAASRSGKTVKTQAYQRTVILSYQRTGAPDGTFQVQLYEPDIAHKKWDITVNC